MPASVNVAAVLAGSEQLPAEPESASVIVTVCADADAVAEQPLKPVPSETVGDAGTEKLLLKTAVIVEVPTRPPDEDDVKPTVHVERAPPLCGEPEKLTEDGGFAADSVAVALAAVVSTDVFKANDLLPVLAGLVSPSTSIDAAVLFPSAQVCPAALARVVLITPPVSTVTPETAQLVTKLLGLSKTTTGVVGIVQVFGGLNLINPPEASAPVELVVKFAVQFAIAPEARDDDETEKLVTVGSIV
jgi:hypothetical protein